ncbi:hypothetical protein [Streptosporangium sp. NPDC003464]
MMFVLAYAPDDLLEEPGHELLLEQDPVASAKHGAPLHVGSCSCGGQPTPPWHQQSVGWEFNDHIETLRAEATRQARVACGDRNGGTHLWMLAVEPDELPFLFCADPECRNATDDLPNDYGDLLAGDVTIGHGLTVGLDSRKHDAPTPMEIPVSVHVVTEEYGGWDGPVEYDVRIKISQRSEK